MSRCSIGVIALSLAASACGGGSGTAGTEETPASSATAEPASAPGLNPCELLTAEQVDSVLSGHDEGFVAKSGGSLIEGVDSYQCSYSNDAGDLFTVVVHIAADATRFEEIEPSPSTARMIHGDSFREVSVGDQGWVAGEPDDMKLTAIRGHAVIELELMSETAGEKGVALARLGSAIADRFD